MTIVSIISYVHLNNIFMLKRYIFKFHDLNLPLVAALFLLSTVAAASLSSSMLISFGLFMKHLSRKNKKGRFAILSHKFAEYFGLFTTLFSIFIPQEGSAPSGGLLLAHAEDWLPSATH